MECAGQLNFGDLFSKDIPLGYYHGFGSEDNKYGIKRGRVIPFRELKNYIGRKVIVRCSTESCDWYRVVEIHSYMPDASHSYKWDNKLKDYVVEHTYDKVSYKLKERSKDFGIDSEIYCEDGRFGPAHDYPSRYYEMLVC